MDENATETRRAKFPPSFAFAFSDSVRRYASQAHVYTLVNALGNSSLLNQSIFASTIYLHQKSIATNAQDPTLTTLRFCSLNSRPKDRGENKISKGENKDASNPSSKTPEKAEVRQTKTSRHIEKSEERERNK